MRAEAAYKELIQHSRDSALLTSCEELLGWDEITYMPRGGVAHRSRQMAHLAGLLHQRATDPRLGELLTVVEQSALVRESHGPPAVNVRELRRQYDRLTRVPRQLVQELAQVASIAQQEWAQARQDADFGRFQPWLEKLLVLKRSEAEALGYLDRPYDALLDTYEPGMTSRAVADLFAALYRELAPLVSTIRGARRRVNANVLQREYPLDRQRVFGENAAAAIGFDFERGRLDTTAHPFFSTIGPGDCRLTARFSLRNFAEGFFTILHEAGHGLYEQGLDPQHHGTPMGEAASLGLHESQARLWENAVGRSRAFWEYFFPQAVQLFREALHDITLDNFCLAVNRVVALPCRVQADEVTYNLHILVRFELEQALLEDELPVADLPDAWNEAYRHHLGVTPRDDGEGCLQDGHWSAGQFGYFPTYTLGNLFASQLLQQAYRDLGDTTRAFAEGDFSGLLDWLRAKVYREGSRYRAAELIERVTGSPPGHHALIGSLKQKYGELYRVSFASVD